MLKTNLTVIGAALFLAGCQTGVTTPQTSDVPAAAAMSMTEQVASATCNSSVPDRYNWLRAERPSVADVTASYNARGINPAETAVFRAYRDYMNSGQDHAAAAALFGAEYPQKSVLLRLSSTTA